MRTKDRLRKRKKSCAKPEPLNRYLREQATQDIRRRVAACFVAFADGRRIADHYNLASASLVLTDLSASTDKKLPRYPTMPTVRMGRLAVDQAFKGKVLAVRCWPMRSSVLPVRRLPPAR